MAFRQKGTELLRPFDQTDGVEKSILDAELIRIVRILKPVQIEMTDIEITPLIGLHQREGRARHFFFGAGQGVDQGPGKCGFAHAKRAFQRDHVASDDMAGQKRCQGPGSGFIGKHEVYRAGVDAGLTWLVLIGVLSSLVAASFYLRIAGIMFLDDAPEAVGVAVDGDGDDVEAMEAAEARMPLLSAGLPSAVAVAAALIVVLGLQPQLLIELAGHAGVLLR